MTGQIGRAISGHRQETRLENVYCKCPSRNNDRSHLLESSRPKMRKQTQQFNIH